MSPVTKEPSLRLRLGSHKGQTAEGEGFEPSIGGYPMPVFKTGLAWLYGGLRGLS